MATSPFTCLIKGQSLPIATSYHFPKNWGRDREKGGNNGGERGVEVVREDFLEEVSGYLIMTIIANFYCFYMK